MQPIKFDQVNMTLRAGENPGTDDMPVALASWEQIPNQMFYVSKWQLSPEELKQVNETGCIFISVMHTPPPIMPLAENPFDQMGFKPLNAIANALGANPKDN